VGELLSQRRKETARRVDELRKELGEAEILCGERACVYATGSFGRGETAPHSDLDVFIVSNCEDGKPGLGRLDEILIKADLIDATRKLQIPEFSGEGEYLVHYTVDELVDGLGKREDDANNTFTARLLLLLESYPLLGQSAYKQIIDDVILAYWEDYPDHKNDFVPAFLANDILRMWRTFCVNYEARTQSAPPERKVKRKLKNYKLKHSRLLTCYSGLLFLLTVFSKNKTVSPLDAALMVSMSPTERLEWMLAQSEISSAADSIRGLLEYYENFLTNTDAREDDLVAKLLDKGEARKYFESQFQFGNGIFEVFNAIGGNNRFHRLLVV
jgi:predicted nucleotidyltransferase